MQTIVILEFKLSLSHYSKIINKNNIRLLETTDKSQSLDNNLRLNLNDGQSLPRQLIES